GRAGPPRLPPRAGLRPRDRRRHHGAPRGASAPAPARSPAMMIGLSMAVLVVLALLSLALALVEASFYLLKRRRLGHLALQNPRAEIANRYLEDPPTLLMPVHMGTYTAHVGMTIVIASLLLHSLSRCSMLVAFAAMVLYLLVFRLSLPYLLVRRNPERALLLLLPFFDSYARALAPLVAALRQRDGAEHGASEAVENTGTHELPPPPALDPN